MTASIDTPTHRRQLLAQRLLAQRLLAQRRTESVARRDDGPRPRLDAAAPAVLSFAQERLWFADRVATNPEQFAIPLALRITGPLDAQRLRAAFVAVVDRHEVLRTRYVQTAAGPRQVTAPTAEPELDFELVDLVGVSEQRQAEAIGAATVHRFDLTTQAPLRVRLHRLAADDHVLVLVIHHIAADSWSVGLLFAEVRARYVGDDLPPLPVQYADFAAWQRDQLDDATLARALDDWEQRLRGATTVLELPVDRARGAQRTSIGRFHRGTLPPEVAARVRRLARDARTSTFTVLLALYRLLIARHTGTPDLLIGVPAAGRPRPEVESLIGCFLNLLVIRGDAGAGGSVLDLVTREHHAVIDGFAHEVPFEQLVQRLRPARGGAASPLFQTTFSFRPEAPALSTLGAATVAEHPLAGGVCLYDLALDLVGTADGGIDAVWAFDDDLFDPATVAAIADRFAMLVDAASRDPRSSVAALPTVTPAERDRLLTLGQPPEPAGAPVDIVDAIWAVAAHAPDAPALADAHGSHDYRWLTSTADRLAAHLRELGVGPEERVGVLLDRTAQLPAALLAVARAGGAWVPLDPTHPAERLRYVLADCGARAVIVADGRGADLVPPGVSVVDLTADAAAIAAADPTTLPAGSGAYPRHRAAYLIYTSGSTGRPKPVAISHDALARFVRTLNQDIAADATTRSVAVSTIAFDVAQLELLAPLVAGGEVFVAGSAVVADGGRLARLIDDWRPSIVHATPSVWRLLMVAGWSPDPAILALCGGEAMPFDLAGWLATAFTEAGNIYGPTEATIYASLHRLGPAQPSTPIGWPLPGVSMYVVDERLRLVPPGTAGELVIGGGTVGRGYPGRPGLTAQRFVPDPFGPPGSRLYHTGDVVRVGADGQLRFLGRNDHQIKVRGFRVEAGEVEAALTAIDSVAAAVVVGQRDANGDGRLVAYVVAAPPARIAIDELRHQLRRVLPEYMVPSLFVPLDELPLNPNGKVDRAALPSADAPLAAAEHVAVDGPAQARIAALWTALLGVENPSARAGFFDLGGHSLTLARLAFALREAFGVEVGLAALFERQTIAEQADLVEELLTAEIATLSDAEADATLRSIA